jgi:pyroglutamyl-peptidase
MAKTPAVLLTGFEPFGGEAINPSWEAVRALHGKRIAKHRIVAVRLPTAFKASRKALKAVIEQHRPALVICIGQAGGRSAVSLERVAINIDDASIADNAGARPVDAPIARRGPAAYFSTLPIKAMCAALQREGIAAEVSQTAGTFVCNHVFYALMHRLRKTPKVRGGFIHIPYLPEQTVGKPGMPAMPLQTVVKALRLAVKTALRTPRDLRLAAGATA